MKETVNEYQRPLTYPVHFPSFHKASILALKTGKTLNEKESVFHFVNTVFTSEYIFQVTEIARIHADNSFIQGG